MGPSAARACATQSSYDAMDRSRSFHSGDTSSRAAAAESAAVGTGSALGWAEDVPDRGGGAATVPVPGAAAGAAGAAWLSAEACAAGSRAPSPPQAASRTAAHIIPRIRFIVRFCTREKEEQMGGPPFCS
jgi:hypothetical protein